MPSPKPSRPAHRHGAAWRTWPLRTPIGLSAVAGLIGAMAPGLPLANPPAAHLPDPMRPPSAEQLATAGPGATARTAGGGQPPARSADTLPVLQSVQVPSRGKPTAMLDGQVVRVGEFVNGMQVMVIDSVGVTLRTPKGPQRIGLVGEGAKQPLGSIAIRQSSGVVMPRPNVAWAPAADVTTGEAAVAPAEGRIVRTPSRPRRSEGPAGPSPAPSPARPPDAQTDTVPSAPQLARSGSTAASTPGQAAGAKRPSATDTDTDTTTVASRNRP